MCPVFLKHSLVKKAQVDLQKYIRFTLNHNIIKSWKVIDCILESQKKKHWYSRAKKVTTFKSILVYFIFLVCSNNIATAQQTWKKLLKHHVVIFAKTQQEYLFKMTIPNSKPTLSSQSWECELNHLPQKIKKCLRPL